ncbi:MAG: YigZ family protein [Hyphomonadaceae bacterium]|nr:YigZ family protein [Clostridia bacterium]
MAFTTYKTVLKEVTAQIIEKKSRFIATVLPIKNEQQAIDYIQKIKTRHWDASHNVYAYKLGEHQLMRYSDDGEPSGTAGIPVLEIIKKEGLTDVLVVVTRYFGGTLLGAGGLVRAYGKSAKEGLHAAGMITMRLCEVIALQMAYTLLGKVQSEILAHKHYVQDILYTDDVEMTVLCQTEHVQALQKQLVECTNGRITWTKRGNQWIAVDEHEKLIFIKE